MNRERCLSQHCLRGSATSFKGFLERNIAIGAAIRSERIRSKKFYRRLYIRAINFIHVESARRTDFNINDIL